MKIWIRFRFKRKREKFYLTFSPGGYYTHEDMFQNTTSTMRFIRSGIYRRMKKWQH